MSLAILTFVHNGDHQVNFRIDTGTNPFYYIKIGRAVTEIEGTRWVDDLTGKTPLKQNKASYSLLDSSFAEQVDKQLFGTGTCYAQLFTFKDRAGRSPGFSRILKIKTGIPPPGSAARSFSVDDDQKINHMPPYNQPVFRSIPYHNGEALATQASVDDVLQNVIKLAGPIVLGLLKGMQSDGNGQPASSSGSGLSPSLGMFNTMLEALLKGLSGGSATPAAQSAAAAPAGHAVSKSMSNGWNRRPQNFSRPFIFGIDDALIASVAGPLLANMTGPLLQMIPQLLTASSQQKLQEKTQTNKLVTDLVADVNRRLMLQEFLQHQPPAAAGSPGNIDITQLLQLLQSLPAAAPAAPATALTKSLSADGHISHTLSSKTLLSFEHESKQTFFGKEKILYKAGTGIRLKLKFNVVEPVPKNPLPKAIVKLVCKDEQQQVVFEKEFKQKDVLPNSVIELPLGVAELANIPLNRCLALVAEMRWQGSQNRELKTFGNTEVIFVHDYFIKEQGSFADDARELTDMQAYRSFWNKVWESPVLDTLKEESDGNRKYGWELDGNLKYTILLSVDHDSNGLMNTRKLVAAKDEDSLRDVTQTRMKGGIELSVHELNKMSLLWDKKQPLSTEQLSAFTTPYLAQNNGGEFIYNVHLKGKRSERGLVWVVPVLKPCSFTLAKSKTVNAFGQITEIQTEEVQFPLPFAARILGIKSM